MDWGASRPATIVVVNDDGPPGQQSPFISAFVGMLIQSLPHAQIVVYLPAQQQSWVSKKIDRFEKVRLTSLSAPPLAFPSKCAASLDKASWALVEGTPATAVLLALEKLHPVQPDLIISGPNIGQNCGSSYILSSGTVGGALEGALQGIKSIALSVSYQELPVDWECNISTITDVCQKLCHVVAKLWKSWPEDVSNLLFNVNTGLNSRPDAQIQFCTSIEETYGRLYLKADSHEHNDGSESFVFDRCLFRKDLPVGTDRRAVNDGYVSVTPLLPRLYEPVLPKHCLDVIMSG